MEIFENLKTDLKVCQDGKAKVRIMITADANSVRFSEKNMILCKHQWNYFTGSLWSQAVVAIIHLFLINLANGNTRKPGLQSPLCTSLGPHN